MIKTSFCSILAGAAFLAVTSIAVRAETQTILVPVDESKILQLPNIPGAVVIGNPAIADVSIQGQQLFVHGRSFGQTNLTILDLQGEQIANFNLVGTIAQDTQVNVYRGAAAGPSKRMSYSCAGSCETNLQVGDNPIYFEMVAQQTSGKFKLATGNTTAEASAPEAPQ